MIKNAKSTSSDKKKVSREVVKGPVGKYYLAQLTRTNPA